MGRKKSLRTMFGKWLSVLLATALLVGNVMGLTVHAKKNPQIQKFNVALVAHWFLIVMEQTTMA